MLTDKELQTLRNMGNEAEAAAEEIEQLRAAIANLADTELRDIAFSDIACIGSDAPAEDALGRLFALVPNKEVSEGE